eukprot:Protomagalhaensia_wolfi_Nauph_80__3172@NODE_322_length_2789_cov_5_557091_g242_i0_p1_GENE_NODE_322_length_2789_cov_5_557091_g242_i0NODE_322_length_2789_cov_5_557091_g242_i0_p1_ORF_typecomplete_len396_score39_53Scs3p/PF10261_9/3e05DUF3533/PF12051_8/6_5e03DUF3533/PF12051_8/0_004DUF2633/PF11119_8/0_28DUF898/PF05987_13/53DUF898/PF05987_13/1_1DUF5592/PF17332_2/5_1e02DUF5592/PF17332_2/4_9e03DUF5592/PF17332_2/1_2_NODE_322_length_2789_cov_5_557091_g242_i09912178
MQDETFSVFIPSHQKRAFRKKRAIDSLYQPDFSLALVCTEFRHTNDVQPNLSPTATWTFNALTSQPFSDSLRQTLLPQCHPSESTHTPPLLARIEYSLTAGLGRRCVLWGTETLNKQHLPPALSASGGLLAPNYIGENLIHGILAQPFYLLLLLIAVWSHSLFAAQAWTGVHLPRLACYVGIALWRWTVLYLGLGQVEQFPPLQYLLQSFNQGNTLQEPIQEPFDFSDHIVATLAVLFILTTELFCLWEFSIRQPVLERYHLQVTTPPPPHNQSPIDDISDQTTDRFIKNQAPSAATAAAASLVQGNQTLALGEVPGHFERPWKLPRLLLRVYLVSLLILIGAFLYAAVATAAFFHSPLESLLGFFIGFIGIPVVFWVLLSSDYLIHGIWFWRDD